MMQVPNVFSKHETAVTHLLHKCTDGHIRVNCTCTAVFTTHSKLTMQPTVRQSQHTTHDDVHHTSWGLLTSGREDRAAVEHTGGVIDRQTHEYIQLLMGTIGKSNKTHRYPLCFLFRGTNLLLTYRTSSFSDFKRHYTTHTHIQVLMLKWSVTVKVKCLLSC